MRGRGLNTPPPFICTEKQTVGNIVGLSNRAAEKMAQKQEVTQESEIVSLPDLPTPAESQNSCCRCRYRIVTSANFFQAEVTAAIGTSLDMIDCN